jgi:hypothetical protein
MLPYFYDLDGNSILYEEWVTLFFATDRHVAHDSIGEYEVSTVWMGLDYSFGNGTPLIYETMIFGPDDLHGWQGHTPNRDAALACHDQALALVRETSSAAR